MKKRFEVLFLAIFTVIITSMFFVNELNVKAGTKDSVIEGIKNLNNTVQNSATVGTVLTQPEVGWKRTKYNNSNVTYSNTSWFYDNTTASCHTRPSKSKPSQYVRFNFVGDKIRIISNTWDSGCANVQVVIDNKITETFSCKGVNSSSDRVLYEKKGLTFGEHSIEIKRPEITFGYHYIFIKAFDISTDGCFKPYNVCGQSVPEAISVSINKLTDNLQVGQTDTLTATTNPSNVAVKWTSSDNNIATVDNTGKITAVAPGTAKITISTDNGLTATCTVTVTQATRALLEIRLIDCEGYEFDLSKAEVDQFIQWYNNNLSPSYMFVINCDAGPFASRTVYIVHNNIVDFQVNEYMPVQTNTNVVQAN